MLGLRSLAVALLATSYAGFASAQAIVNGKQSNYPDGYYGDSTHPGPQTMCLLSGFSFSPAMTITPAFDMAWYHYTIDCSEQFPGNQFIAKPTPAERGSSAETWWNNKPINQRSPAPGNAISVGGYVANSPNKQSSAFTFVKGFNNLTVGVGCNGDGTPPCYYKYYFTCTIGSTPGATGDPQFVGLRGQSYQVHGVAGEIYNIVSDADLQYNSRFVFLTSGACPIVDGVKQKACWSHPGSFLGELGLKTREGDKIRIVSGSADAGFESVTVNGKELSVGSTLLLSGDMGSVTRNSTHLTHVLVANWDFAFENSDMFVNQRVRVLDARKLASHGLLGQTWRTATYPNAVKYIQGAVDDYVVREKDIFGDNFLYNQFN